MSDSMELVDTVKTAARKQVVADEVVHKTLQLIQKGTESSQPRLVSRGIRQNVGIRKHVTPAQLSMVLEKYVPVDCVSSPVMKELIGKITVASEKLGENIVTEEKLIVGDEADMDTASDDKNETGESEEKISESGPTVPPTAILPEVEVYFFTLLVTTLLRYDLVDDACMASAGLIQRIGQFNRRSLDIVASKAFSYVNMGV